MLLDSLLFFLSTSSFLGQPVIIQRRRYLMNEEQSVDDVPDPDGIAFAAAIRCIGESGYMPTLRISEALKSVN